MVLQVAQSQLCHSGCQIALSSWYANFQFLQTLRPNQTGRHNNIQETLRIREAFVAATLLLYGHHCSDGFDGCLPEWLWLQARLKFQKLKLQSKILSKPWCFLAIPLHHEFPPLLHQQTWFSLNVFQAGPLKLGDQMSLLVQTIVFAWQSGTAAACCLQFSTSLYHEGIHLANQIWFSESAHRNAACKQWYGCLNLQSKLHNLGWAHVQWTCQEWSFHGVWRTHPLLSLLRKHLDHQLLRQPPLSWNLQSDAAMHLPALVASGLLLSMESECLFCVTRRSLLLLWTMIPCQKSTHEWHPSQRFCTHPSNSLLRQLATPKINQVLSWNLALTFASWACNEPKHQMDTWDQWTHVRELRSKLQKSWQPRHIELQKATAHCGCQLGQGSI